MRASRPLDSAFQEDSRHLSNNRRFSFKSIFLLTLFSLSSISAVYAANVSINGGSDISYSQGVEVIAPCDPDGIDVDLDFYFFNGTYDSYSWNIWALSNREQRLTGIHRDCFSVYNGAARRLKLYFYEGTSLQLSVVGQMPFGVHPTNAANYMHPTDSTIIFFGTQSTGTNLAATFFESFDPALSYNRTSSPSGTSFSCDFNDMKPNSADKVKARLCGSFATNQQNSLNGSPTIAWSNSGCARLVGQGWDAVSTKRERCRPWNIAANTDRIVLEIE